MTISLPPPIPGIPFDVETADSRVAGYRLGEHRRVIQPGAVRAPLAFIFGDHPRFTDPAAEEALVTTNDHLERITDRARRRPPPAGATGRDRGRGRGVPGLGLVNRRDRPMAL